MPQDETAFAQFYARQVNTVYRICYVKLKNQMDAEDVTQEVFLRAMQQPQLWGDDAHAKAWLIVTASNLCKNAVQHWSRSKREEVEDWEAFLGATEPPEEESAVFRSAGSVSDRCVSILF